MEELQKAYNSAVSQAQESAAKFSSYASTFDKAKPVMSSSAPSSSSGMGSSSALTVDQSGMMVARSSRYNPCFRRCFLLVLDLWWFSLRARDCVYVVVRFWFNLLHGSLQYRHGFSVWDFVIFSDCSMCLMIGCLHFDMEFCLILSFWLSDWTYTCVYGWQYLE